MRCAATAGEMIFWIFEKDEEVNYCGLKMMLTGIRRVRDHHLYKEGTSNYGGEKKEIRIGIEAMLRCVS